MVTSVATDEVPLCANTRKRYLFSRFAYRVGTRLIRRILASVTLLFVCDIEALARMVLARNRE